MPENTLSQSSSIMQVDTQKAEDIKQHVGRSNLPSPDTISTQAGSTMPNTPFSPNGKNPR
jgi:hypothetical protein